MCEKIRENIESLTNVKVEENNFETITGHGLNLVLDHTQKEFKVSKNKFKITKKMLAKEENQVDSRLYEFISKNIQIKMLGNDRSNLFKMLLQFQQQLEEKQKTIDEINKEFVQAVHDWKALCAEKDKEIERLKEITIFKDNRNMTTKINGVDFSDEQIIILQNLDVLKKYDQTQLAIQELEKVKTLLQNAVNYEGHTFVGMYDAVNNQIKELKGEKDERI